MTRINMYANNSNIVRVMVGNLSYYDNIGTRIIIFGIKIIIIGEKIMKIEINIIIFGLRVVIRDKDQNVWYKDHDNLKRS